MPSSRIVGFNTESVTSLVGIGTLILKSRESKCVYKCVMTFDIVVIFASTMHQNERFQV